MKFASLGLVTDDLPRLSDFYVNLLGVEPTLPFGGEDYAELHAEGCVLALVTKRGVDQFNAGAAAAAENRSAILEFEVDDVDGERSRLDASVTEWVQDPVSQPWGNRSMLFRDPDGNLINVYTPPPAAA